MFLLLLKPAERRRFVAEYAAGVKVFDLDVRSTSKTMTPPLRGEARRIAGVPARWTIIDNVGGLNYKIRLETFPRAGEKLGLVFCRDAFRRHTEAPTGDPSANGDPLAVNPTFGVSETFKKFAEVEPSERWRRIGG